MWSGTQDSTSLDAQTKIPRKRLMLATLVVCSIVFVVGLVVGIAGTYLLSEVQKDANVSICLVGLLMQEIFDVTDCLVLSATQQQVPCGSQVCTSVTWVVCIALHSEELTKQVLDDTTRNQTTITADFETKRFAKEMINYYVIGNAYACMLDKQGNTENNKWVTPKSQYIPLMAVGYSIAFISALIGLLSILRWACTKKKVTYVH